MSGLRIVVIVLSALAVVVALASWIGTESGATTVMHQVLAALYLVAAGIGWLAIVIALFVGRERDVVVQPAAPPSQPADRQTPPVAPTLRPSRRPGATASPLHRYLTKDEQPDSPKNHPARADSPTAGDRARTSIEGERPTRPPIDQTPPRRAVRPRQPGFRSKRNSGD